VPIIWNADPVLFSLGPVQIRWYGLMFLIGFVVGLRGMRWVCKKEGYNPEKMESLFTYVFLGTLIGARLGHCFFYEPAYFLTHPLEIFMVWKGGLASHGGVTGVIIALLIFVRNNKEFNFLWILDRVCMFTAITGGLIRIGNLMNSEIIGKPTGSDFGFIFAHIDNVVRHPTQIYESLCYFTLAFSLLMLYRKMKYKPPQGLIFGISLIAVFTTRFVIEFFKENQESFESSMAINMGQLLSIPFILVGIGLIVYALKFNSANPGKKAKQA
jgi:prolipoprotein diacylglyceryl transferase